MRDCEAGVGDAEGVHPANFGIKAEDLPERENDADAEDRDDQAVEAGIGFEGFLELG